MRITNFAILFIVIILPFVVINMLNVEAQIDSLFLESRYNSAIDAASQDAATMLIYNAKQGNEALYESPKSVRLNKEKAAEAFFQTLYLNFGVADDPYAQGALARYVPALVAIGYDGYFIYSEQEYIDAKGEVLIKHAWSMKKPYSYQDAKGNLLSFTLDDYVTVYEASTKSLKRGYLFEVDPTTGRKYTSSLWSETDVPLLIDTTNFDSVRRQVIVAHIQDDLEYEINKHNHLVRRYGVAYTFTLPTIDQEEWNNTVDDVGVLAFVQGIPVGNQYYNNFALGGARIMKKPEIKGITVNGIKYYYNRSICESSVVYHETFPNEKVAAENGYHPLSCLNK